MYLHGYSNRYCIALRGRYRKVKTRKRVQALALEPDLQSRSKRHEGSGWLAKGAASISLERYPEDLPVAQQQYF